MNCQAQVQELQARLALDVVECNQMDTFASLLTEYIRDHEPSVSAFARKMGVSHTAVNNVINGQSRATAEFVIKAAKAMGEAPFRMLALAGYVNPLPPAVDDEQEIITAVRQLPPHARLILVRIAHTLMEEATQIAAGNRMIPPRETVQAPEERKEIKEQLLGELAYDPDEMAVRALDWAATHLTTESLYAAAEDLLRIARQRQEKTQDNVNGQPQQPGGTEVRQAYSVLESPQRPTVRD